MKQLAALLFVFVLGFLSFSCENECDIQTDIDQLKIGRETLQKEVRQSQNLYDNLKIDINRSEIELSDLKFEKKIINEDLEPYYILKVKLKQTHVTLDIGKHIKDGINAVEFQIVVDKRFYNSINVGDELLKDFRAGSFWIDSSIGNWKITVEDKQVVLE